MKFLIEAWNRLTMPNSPFFKVIQAISAITAFVATIPLLIVKFQTDLGIEHIPEVITSISTKTVYICAIIAWVIAQFSVKPVISTIAEAKALPYTDKIESK